MFETKLESRWADAVRARCSVRRYTAAPTEEQIDRLGVLARQLSWQGIRISLFRGPGLKRNIKGTNVYAVIVAAKDTPAEMEGYAGEALVLECATMGLGTCWMGGFDKYVIKNTTKLKEGENIRCVIAIGQCAPQAPAHKRKPLAATCGLADAQRAALPAWQQAALDFAAIAPSAINRQPWRFVVAPRAIQVLDGGSNFGFGALDRGIAMLHVAVGAMSAGIQGAWKPVENGWEFRAK